MEPLPRELNSVKYMNLLGFRCCRIQPWWTGIKLSVLGIHLSFVTEVVRLVKIRQDSRPFLGGAPDLRQTLPSVLRSFTTSSDKQNLNELCCCNHPSSELM